MFRNISKGNIVVLILISILLGGIVRFAFSSSAASTYYHMFNINTSGAGRVYDTSGPNQKDQINCTSPTSVTPTNTNNCRYDYQATSATYSYRAAPNSGYALASWKVTNTSNTPDTTTVYLNDGRKWALNTISLRRDINYKVVANFEKATTCSISASPTSVTKGGSTIIKWSSANATSLTSNFGVTQTSGSISKAPASNTTYTVTAKNITSSKACSATVTVTAAPVTPPPPPPVPVDDGGEDGGSNDAGDGDYLSDSPGEDLVEISAGDSGIEASESTEESDDKEPPTLPGNLKAEFSAEENSITVTWDDSTDNTEVSAYEVQRQEKGTGKWEAVGEVTSSQYVDFTFAPNKTYLYQVRAGDLAGNFSAWSSPAEASAGDFKANVTVAEGGSITDSTKTVTVEIPKDAVGRDLIVKISKIKVKGMTMPANTKLVGSYYEIQAKDSEGKEVTKFKRQILIKFNYKKSSLFGASKSSLKIASSEDGKKVTVARTVVAGDYATTLTDHFSIYFLTAAKTGFWGTLLWILVWLLLIGGGIALFYFGWRKYQLKNYQQEHAEDFIYKH